MLDLVILICEKIVGPLGSWAVAILLVFVLRRLNSHTFDVMEPHMKESNENVKALRASIEALSEVCLVLKELANQQLSAMREDGAGTTWTHPIGVLVRRIDGLTDRLEVIEDGLVEKFAAIHKQLEAACRLLRCDPKEPR